LSLGEAHFDLDEALGAEERIGNEGEGGSAADSEAVLWQASEILDNAGI
jgi:hypothetical protein